MSARPPPECAQCGAAIPPQARACPACGADERTGWRETSIYDGLDLPDSAGSETDTIPPGMRDRRVNGMPWYWWCIAVGVLLAFALGALALL